MMKKSSSYLIFSTAFLATFAVAALIIGACRELLSLPSFWLVWLITFLPIAASIVVTHLLVKKSDEFFSIFPLITVSSVFEALSLILGTTLIALPALIKSTSTWYLWVFELILVVLYSPILVYFFFGTNHIVTHRKTIKKKIFYIRNLTSQITVALPSVKDSQLKKEFASLAEDIRYSDPISKDFVQDIEQKISETVEDLILRASNDASYEDCKLQIHKAKMLILQRNEMIQNVK